MLRAWKNKEGSYYITSDRSSETYYRRHEFKRLNAFWDGYHWIITEDQREQLGIEKMVRVRVEPHHCQNDGIVCVQESQAIVGEKAYASCPMCDSHYWSPIIEILS